MSVVPESTKRPYDTGKRIRPLWQLWYAVLMRLPRLQFYFSNCLLCVEMFLILHPSVDKFVKSSGRPPLITKKNNNILRH